MRMSTPVVLGLLIPSFSASLLCQSITIDRAVLKDKIKGGWVGQVVGCTYGGPTEFKYQGTFIKPYTPIAWYDGYLEETFKKSPGLYDDLYMDLAFVTVIEEKGLDAPAAAFAKAFAYADFPLWHANQMARYNIRKGMMPPESGHWLNNPHADDIDFQIEADFAGLMSPGMVNTAAEICDRVGHIMNYGDGWYGGVYVAGMYALAFVSDDIGFIVEEALKLIPEKSQFYQCIQDVIQWHNAFPDDWTRAWFEVEKKWAEDRGCPEGVFDPFNIDAKINSAYIALGLLYGEGDFGRTLDISTRCGQDSDCNPASAGGILGTVIGYAQIPSYWKQGLSAVEPVDFKYTSFSLNDAYDLSYRHALQVIQRNGGALTGDEVIIKTQDPAPVRLEAGFANHFPVEKKRLDQRFSDQTRVEFDGIGFAINGSANMIQEAADDGEYTFEVEMWIDGRLVETTTLPTDFTTRKFSPFWRYRLSKGIHRLLFKVLNPTEKAEIHLRDMVVYGDQASVPGYPSRRQ